MAKETLHAPNIIACLWDFDKTLIPGYMQTPLFEAFGIQEKQFWDEVNALPAAYAAQGQHVSNDIIYLNHLLSYVRHGLLGGLTNERLRQLGAELKFYPGLPHFFQELKDIPQSVPEYVKADIRLEHYVISTGLAEMIRGSTIAPHVDGIFGCEFIENPLPPLFNKQDELVLDTQYEIAQLGVVVDNTIKTRYIFEINKGSNKNPSIDVNATMRPEDRRIPMDRMIYVADGPSDVPVFSVIRKGGGRAFAVYNPDVEGEFAQNDSLLNTGRIHAYGPADYQSNSQTGRWLKMHVHQICDQILQEHEYALRKRVRKPPRHLHPENEDLSAPPDKEPEQSVLFSDDSETPPS
ncbi:MAG: HAD family hydrolase [Verrucomicrobiota bacterium]